MDIDVKSKSFQRNRPGDVMLCLRVIATGLAWRSRLLALPQFIAKYGGDALWALLVFFGFAFIFHRRSTRRIALIALGFA